MLIIEKMMIIHLFLVLATFDSTFHRASHLTYSCSPLIMKKLMIQMSKTMPIISTDGKWMCSNTAGTIRSVITFANCSNDT